MKVGAGLVSVATVVVGDMSLVGWAFGDVVEVTLDVGLCVSAEVVPVVETSGDVTGVEDGVVSGDGPVGETLGESVDVSPVRLVVASVDEGSELRGPPHATSAPQLAPQNTHKREHPTAARTREINVELRPVMVRACVFCGKGIKGNV
jgi:hypothetical protein